jgi:hypothetical protein
VGPGETVNVAAAYPVSRLIVDLAGPARGAVNFGWISIVVFILDNRFLLG